MSCFNKLTYLSVSPLPVFFTKNIITINIKTKCQKNVEEGQAATMQAGNPCNLLWQDLLLLNSYTYGREL